MRRPDSIDKLPPVVPVFPLAGALLLPAMQRPLNIFEPRFLEMVDFALAHDRLIGLIQPKETAEESPLGKVPLQKVGCLGRITHFEETADDRYVIVLEGLVRFDCIKEIDGPAPFRQFEINASRFAQDFDPSFGEQAVNRARFVELIRSYADYAQLDIDWDELEQVGTAELVNSACMLSPYGAAEKQLLLEAQTLAMRAETLTAIAELEMARGQSGATLQ